MLSGDVTTFGVITVLILLQAALSNASEYGSKLVPACSIKKPSYSSRIVSTAAVFTMP